MFQGVSTSGGSNLLVQIGSGSVTTTGYSGYVFLSATGRSAFSTGFMVTGLDATTSVMNGSAILSLFSGNTWLETGIITDSSASVLGSSQSAGSVALGGALDRVRITTVNGTDAFDAGTINILYE
jgi:hypothetical protein